MGDLLLRDQRVTNQCGAVQVLAVHIYGGDLPVFVGGVIVNAARGVAAGGVQGDLILPIAYFTAAALLFYRS